MKRERVASSILLFALPLIFLSVSIASAQQKQTQPNLSKLITNGGYTVKDGPLSLSFKQEKRFLPASTLKIVTALAALELLGPDFRFETHLFYDQQHNLYIKGYGDPFLTSEEVLRLCSQLKQSGIREIESLYLDFSAFDLRGETPGSHHSSNPYDAPNGALAVNFNSLFINKLKNGDIVSGESQTPTLPIMQKIEEYFPEGKQRINVEMAKSSKQFSPAEQYVGELFYAQLKNIGISVQGTIATKEVPSRVSPTLRYKNSKTLKEMIQECLQYSNNFIANQIFLYCGSYFFRSPATWKKSQDFIQQYLTKNLSLRADQFSIVDGSGLSRENAMSPEALTTVLQNFAPFRKLLGIENRVYIKSGTLDGVYCYAGYLPKVGATYVPFAILLNQKKNTRDAILEGLKMHVAAHQ